MPAMSRQTLSGASRSAIVLAGSPSKSMIFQPDGVRSVWPRWKSPCTRCTSQLGVGQRTEAGQHAVGVVRPAPARSPGRPRTARPSPRRRRLRSRGQWGTRPAARRGSRPARCPAGSPRRRTACRRQARPGPAPSRPRRPSASPPASPGRPRRSWSRCRQSASTQPYSRATSRDVGLVQRVVDLDVEIATELEPSEQLQHRRLAEHDRGIGLLAAERLRLVGRAQIPRCRSG